MLSKVTRTLIITGGLLLIAVLFVPLWQIDLVAPQYPEGLSLIINPDGLGGSVDIINGLNHYIGMKTLHNDDFPEFVILPWIIKAFALAFLVTGVAGRKKGLKILTFCFVAFGIIAMADFWKWEYQYGHDLNPDAAIIVPGMAYQPPLIGYKQLLNFTAYSMPSTGGWLFVAAGAILVFSLVYETRFRKVKVGTAALLLIACGIFTSCNAGPAKINYGKDNCDNCKMTLSDVRFGVVLNTSKGRNYKFDDIHCLENFLEAHPDMKGTAYMTNYCLPNELQPASKMHFLKSDQFQSPMGGNIAAFSNKDSLTRYQTLTGAETPEIKLPVQ